MQMPELLQAFVLMGIQACAWRLGARLGLSVLESQACAHVGAMKMRKLHRPEPDRAGRRPCTEAAERAEDPEVARRERLTALFYALGEALGLACRPCNPIHPNTTLRS